MRASATSRRRWPGVIGTIGRDLTGLTGPSGPRSADLRSFPISGRAGAAGAYERPSVGRSVLSIEEIREVTVSDAYDAVRILRPEWLAQRPPDIIGDPDSGAIRVYLDDFRLGGARSLIGLSVDTIDSIRFISAAVATARWGVGHARGVIQVVTTPGLP